jgi:hypothetical protein
MNAELTLLRKRIEALEKSVASIDSQSLNLNDDQQKNNNTILCGASSGIKTFDIVRIGSSGGKQSCAQFTKQGSEVLGKLSIGVALEDSGRSSNILVAVSGSTYAKVSVKAAKDALTINTPLIPENTGGALKKSSGTAIFYALEDAVVGAEFALVKFATNGGSDSEPKPFTISAADAEGNIKVEAGNIIAGLTTLSYPGTTTFALSGNCYPSIAVKRTLGGGAYTITFFAPTSFPTQSDTEWYLTLGYVEMSGTSITKITQYVDGTQYIDRVC